MISAGLFEEVHTYVQHKSVRFGSKPAVVLQQALINMGWCLRHLSSGPRQHRARNNCTYRSARNVSRRRTSRHPHAHLASCTAVICCHARASPRDRDILACISVGETHSASSGRCSSRQRRSHTSRPLCSSLQAGKPGAALWMSAVGDAAPRLRSSQSGIRSNEGSTASVGGRFAPVNHICLAAHPHANS